MSLLTPLALLIGLLVVGPLVAHALRRGQAAPVLLPTARLVSEIQATTKRRSRLQDRGLLALRILLLLGLALLGASPFVSCSRLSLLRSSGGSVAVALVLDDSASMRVQDGGTSRFAQAIEGARQLVGSARAGDAFSIVAAGKPARMISPPTTDLAAVLDVLSALRVSDRRTDLSAGLRLGESSLAALPQADRHLIVFSDFATEQPVSLPETATAPLPELRRPFENCAVTHARRLHHTVNAEIGCTSPRAAQDRRVELLGADGKVLASAELSDVVQLDAKSAPLDAETSVRLTAGQSDSLDQIPEDDLSPVLRAGPGLLLGIRADAERSGLRTGGSTVLKAAFDALASPGKVEPLAVLPETASELEPYSALLIDDPAGFTPEVADALTHFAEAGGVLAGFLGPRVKKAPLGSDFRPFVAGAARWSSEGSLALDPSFDAGLDPLAAGWNDMVPTGRVVVSHQPEARVLSRFTDGEPLILERSLGRGLALTVLLPSSVDVSDLALRPAFLALLDRISHQAAIRHGAAATECGTPWQVAPGTEVIGPAGPLESEAADGHLMVTPHVAGRYELIQEGRKAIRYAVMPPDEALRQPRPVDPQALVSGLGAGKQDVDISREIALLVLLLGALELGLRVLLRSGPQGPIRSSRRPASLGSGA